MTNGMIGYAARMTAEPAIICLRDESDGPDVATISVVVDELPADLLLPRSSLGS